MGDDEKRQVQAMKVRVTAENYQQEVVRENLPVLVEFFAAWCSKCAMMEDVVDMISAEYGRKLKVCQIEIDESAGLADEFQVEAVPTFVLFKNGEPVSAASGVSDKEVLLDMLYQEMGLRI